MKLCKMSSNQSIRIPKRPTTRLLLLATTTTTKSTKSPTTLLTLLSFVLNKTKMKT